MAVAVCMRSPAVLQSEGASYVIATFSLHDVRSPKAQHAFVNLALELLEKVGQETFETRMHTLRAHELTSFSFPQRSYHESVRPRPRLTCAS